MSTQLFDGDFDEDGIGADPGVTFDPTGLRVGNYFPNEVTDPVSSPVVFSKNGPFYSDGLLVKGILITETHTLRTLVTLQLGVDYIYSPQFNLIKQLLGLDAFSYVVLIDKTKWSSIHLSYHAVGAVVDQILMSEIGSLGTFDQNDLTIWSSLIGDSQAFNKLKINDLLSQTSNVYILSRELELISKNLDAPAEWLEYIKQEFDVMTTAVSGFQSKIDSLNATIAQTINSISNVDLSPYLLKSDLPTTQEVSDGTLPLAKSWSPALIKQAVLDFSTTFRMVIVTDGGVLPVSIKDASLMIKMANYTYANSTITLPEAGAFGIGRVELVNVGDSNLIRLNPSALNVFKGNSGTVGTLFLGGGESVILECDGDNTWYVVGGSMQLQFSPSYSCVFNGGSLRIGNTLIQCVRGTTTNGIGQFVFSATFPNNILHIGAQLLNNTFMAQCQLTMGDYTLSGGRVVAGNGNGNPTTYGGGVVGYSVFAIGN
jgi:hypothetical protein